MRQVSKKKQKIDREYQAARLAVWERSGGACEGMVAPFCNRRCEQVHHKAGRVGPDPHRLDNLIGLCSFCHEWAHRFPQQAIEAGVSVSRLKAWDV